MRQVQVSSQEAYNLLSSQQDKPNFTFFCNSLSEGAILLMELIGADAHNKWLSIIGISDITQQYGEESYSKIYENLLAGRRMGRNTACYQDTTCCIIKPHIVASGMAGAMLYEIQKAGFEISAIQSVKFTKPNAEEFLEVYKGVLHEYPVIKGFFLGLCLSHMFFIESSHKKNTKIEIRFCLTEIMIFTTFI